MHTARQLRSGRFPRALLEGRDGCGTGELVVCEAGGLVVEFEAGGVVTRCSLAFLPVVVGLVATSFEATFGISSRVVGGLMEWLRRESLDPKAEVTCSMMAFLLELSWFSEDTRACATGSSMQSTL